MTTIRTAFYARVSGEQQATAHTIESQIAALSERASSDGTPVPPERQFVDNGYSGATLIRPALDRLRDFVSVGAIDKIYVHSPDRLARNYAYQVLLLDEWRRRGVEVVFLNRPLGQSPEDDLLLQVQGIVAEYELAKIMERSRRGKKHAAQNGSLNVMSGAPFGYRYVPVREGAGFARFEPVAEQARVVQQIFSWIGRDRCSLAEVCRRLHKAGMPTATGKSTCTNPGQRPRGNSLVRSFQASYEPPESRAGTAGQNDERQVVRQSRNPKIAKDQATACSPETDRQLRRRSD